MRRAHKRGRWRGRLGLAGLLAAVVFAAVLALPAGASADFSLTITLSGSGSGAVECRVNEGVAGACASSYPEGTDVELLPTPSAGSTFAEFTGACTGEACDLILNEDQSVTAIFTSEPAEYSLEIGQGGTGEGEWECIVGGEAEFCAEEYPEGTHVTVKATPFEGSKSAVFAGDCTGSTCSLIMDKDHAVTVIFNLKEFTLTVKKNGGTSSGKVICEREEGPEPCMSKYSWGTEVTLTAIPEPEYEFVKWEGCDREPQPGSCEVEIEEARSVTVTFSKELGLANFTLKVKKEGTGTGTVTSSPAGINCGVTCSFEFEEGKEVTLTATPEGGSTFAGWSGSGCSGTSTCKVTMSAAKEVTATFNPPAKPKFKLTVKKVGTGTVTSSPAGINCGVTCSFEFESGKEVTLTPVADSGSEFVSWSGACSGSGTCKVTMSAAKEVTATFDLRPVPTYTLTVQREGGGAGSVMSDPAGINCGADCSEDYPEGAWVTLTATPADGSVFKRWTGVESGCALERVCRTRMGDAKVVKAVFDSADSPPSPESAGMARVVKRVALVRGGRALLDLRCAGGPCKGGLKLTARLKMGKKSLVIGKRSFTLSPGARATVQVRLSASAKREVAARGRLAVEVMGGGVFRATVKLTDARRGH